MIPGTKASLQRQTWQKLLADGVATPQELLNLLDLNTALPDAALFAHQQFATKVPRGYVARMRKGDINDPLLRQVLPLAAEMELTSGFVKDPLAEIHSNPLPGLLHKYQGRVLLTLTGACAIHCRYCFRRHFPYAENNPGKAGWRDVIDYLNADPSITEVILSGGDPLIATDKTICELGELIATIPHIKRLRIHTRLPIVLPQRITDTLLTWFSNSRLQIVIVIHANHANEIDDSVKHALQQLRETQVTLLNQSVLLSGINDSASALCDLSEALFAASVLPYYLHILDRVQGAAHFDVSEETAKNLMRDVMQRLPGYLVPKLVREVAGESSKINIS